MKLLSKKKNPPGLAVTRFNQAPARIQVYSCIYDEYKGFILYLYLQITTDFVLTIIGATCHFWVAEFSISRHLSVPGLSFGNLFQKLCTL